MNDLLRAAKLLGSCILIGFGLIAKATSLPRSDGPDLPTFIVLLGLWLLFTAWAGRNPLKWLIQQCEVGFRWLVETPPSPDESSRQRESPP